MTTAFRFPLSLVALTVLMTLAGTSGSAAQARENAAGTLGTLAAPAPVTAIGEMQSTTTRYEDTLVHLARKYGVGFVEIRAANPGVDPWLPGNGTRIIIPTMHLLPNAPHRGIIINLSEMRMYYYQPGESAPATYPVGVGREGLRTPTGTTTIARKQVDPIWRPTDRMRREDPTLKEVVGPGPENPMGTHAMYLGWASYAIHGTDKPYSIGRRQSSGCIRMYPEDILTLFDNVSPGTPVTVVDQPVKAAWIGDRFYVEAHPTQDQADILSRDSSESPHFQVSEQDLRVILKAAGGAADQLDWKKIRKTVKERRGFPVEVARRSQVVETSAPGAAVSQ